MPEDSPNALESALRRKAEQAFAERIERVFLTVRRELVTDTLYAKTSLHQEGKAIRLNVEAILVEAKKTILEAQRKTEGDKAVRQFLHDFQTMREKMNELGIDLPEVDHG